MSNCFLLYRISAGEESKIFVTIPKFQFIILFTKMDGLGGNPASKELSKDSGSP